MFLMEGAPDGQKTMVRLARDGAMHGQWVVGNIRDVTQRVHDEYCSMLALQFAGQLQDVHIRRVVEALALRLGKSDTLGQAIDAHLSTHAEKLTDEEKPAAGKRKA